ncbi:polysaccharide deacetylase family protein [Adlercreutzia faecimuris]|uniref:Polysaccharide deacetylase family protein n=1 Tax=Adlercreutzia faecimuris TaxID=2897341 RepID=A0ABS9WG93_9ACTN|nr:polysaccharide deacetylase family protein [Adlercreutzia sp. JBNU-10]MCI2241605.1 polysaccharide deacetylase family protein [Adlercreutzia sp. JBNU-10]
MSQPYPQNNPRARRGRYAAPVDAGAPRPRHAAHAAPAQDAARQAGTPDDVPTAGPAAEAPHAQDGAAAWAGAEEAFEFVDEAPQGQPAGAVPGNPRDRVTVSARPDAEDAGVGGAVPGGIVIQPGVTGSTPVIGVDTAHARVIPRADGDEPLRGASPTPRLQGARDGAVALPDVRRRNRPRRPSRGALIAAALVIAVVGAGAYLLLNPPVMSLTVNGQTIQVPSDTSIDKLIADGTVAPAPGDLLAVDGSLLQEGGGKRFTAQVNGEPFADGAARLPRDAAISVTDGADDTEDYAEEEVAAPPTIGFEGVGAIHAYEGTGAAGTSLRRTGSVSGITVDEVVTEPVAEVVKKYNADTAGDKVVALTFDDGPWPESTDAILDILDQNGAKATFFTIGQQISGGNAESVKRAAAAGHQISSHSFDHASAGDGRGVDMGRQTAQEQVDEVLKGYEAIEAATGAPASHAFRTPGGNFSAETAQILQPHITAEIGWNIDTEDWRRPGAQAIADRIKQAKPGSIILMHDGGGDRSQTVEALRQALPYLREQGYRFITIDELLAYNDPADM